MNLTKTLSRTITSGLVATLSCTAAVGVGASASAAPTDLAPTPPAGGTTRGVGGYKTPPSRPDPDPRPVATLPPVYAASPNVCGVAGGLPGGAQDVEVVVTDVDADGQDDTVTSYFVALGDSAGWRLRTDLADGPTDDHPIEGVGVGIAKILGGVQVDYDVADAATNPQELLVQAGTSAGGPNLTVFGLDDDDCLFRFENEYGGDISFPIHSSISTKGGLKCDFIAGTQFLVQRAAEHFQGSMYHATQTILERVGDALVPDAVIHSDIDADTQTDWLNEFEQLECGAVTL